MRKRIILGDIHGRYDVIHKIYDLETPDDVICLGDYVDSHEYITDEDQHESLKKLVRLQFTHIQEKKGEFILLLGNHDFHYLYANPMVEKYSGYSYDRAEWAPEFYKQLVDCKQMQVIYIDKINKTIYSHAGISNVWLNNHDLSIYDVNGCLENENSWDVFRFTYGSRFSGTGDCPENSCIWIRPYSLLNNIFEDSTGTIWTQIVGHTPVQKNIVCINKEKQDEVDISEANLILTDNLPYQYIVEWINDDGTLYSREIVDNIYAKESEHNTLADMLNKFGRK